MERALLHRCYTSTLVSSLTNASVFSLISYSVLRQLVPNRRLALALSIVPVCLVTSAVWDPSSNCYVRVARQIDSPLGADVRTVLRSKYPGNGLTAAIDSQDRERAEKDRLSGTGLPLLWDLPLRKSSLTVLRKEDEQEQHSLEQQGEPDVMVMTEEENSEARGTFTPQQSFSKPAVASTSTSSPTTPLSSSSSNPSSASSSASVTRPSAPSSSPRAPAQPTSHDEDADNPFADDDPSIRPSSAADAVSDERRRRREERERVRKQHEDERRQRMAQRSREDGRMSGAAAAVGVSDAKRRFVRRNEFGDEVYADEDMK